MTKRIPLAVALAGFAMACSDPMTSTPTRTLVPSTSSLAVTATIGYPFSGILDGQLRLCKTSNVLGTYNFTASGGGAAPITPLVVAPSITIDVSGETECTIIYRSSVSQASGAETITITETSVAVPLATIDILQYLDPTVGAGPFPYGNLGDAPYRNDSFVLGTRTATVKINNDMARRVTFTNLQTEADICDFITFGRLVWESGDQKVVISGNAGGFNADGSIKGEFHIEVNDVDHHVHDIASYSPITSGALLSSSFTNSRRVTGTDIHGHSVDLRLWDNGEPGKSTDRFWFNVNGTILGNAVSGNLIDQGNMQYHPNCRGPQQ